MSAYSGEFRSFLRLPAQAYDNDDRYSSHRTSMSAWAELAWRRRITLASEKFEGDLTLRCFDYADFKSQHDMLTVFLVQAMWAQRMQPEHKSVGPTTRDFAELCAHCSLATLNANIKWSSGRSSTMYSTLASGVRLTSENTWSSISYEGVIRHNAFLFFALVTVKT